MSLTRRDAIFSGAALAGVAALVKGAERAEAAEPESRWDASYSGNPVTGKETPGEPGKDYQPVVTPNGSTLPFKVVDGVKVFHLVAEEVEHEFAPVSRRSAGDTTAPCTARRSRRSKAIACAST